MNNLPEILVFTMKNQRCFTKASRELPTNGILTIGHMLHNGGDAIFFFGQCILEIVICEIQQWD